MKVGDKVLCKKMYKSKCAGHNYQFKDGQWYKISFITSGGFIVKYGKYKGRKMPTSITVEVKNKIGKLCVCVLTTDKNYWLNNPYFYDYFYSVSELRKEKLKQLKYESVHE